MEIVKAQPESGSDAPLPSRIGPYRITKLLGAGGMGIVYRGEHEVTGQAAAVKTIRLPHPRHLASMRCEIHALTGLARHPGVVQFLDEGVEQGVPWYAMEHLTGPTLADHVARLWRPVTTARTIDIPGDIPGDDSGDHSGNGAGHSNGAGANRRNRALDATVTGDELTLAFGEGAPFLPPPPTGPHGGTRPAMRRPEAAAGHLAEALSILRGVADTMSYVHGQGVVHRDLKPGNVFLRPDGMPVVVDFGLVSRARGIIGREELEVSGLLVGTAAYIAPEQARGSFVDARADLYAFGCMLYEMLTGRPPFDGARVEEVVHAHLHSAPAPPSQYVDGVPPALDDLVLGLLAKRPRDRIGHADDVSSMLAALGAGGGYPQKPGLESRPYLFRPEIAGRTETLGELTDRTEHVEGGEGGFVLIGGESGVGKTFLVAEMARRAATRKMTVVTGECLPLGAESGPHEVRGTPLHPFRTLLQAVADRCRAKGASETHRLLGARGKVLAPFEPSLSHLPGQESYPDPSPLPAGGARSRLLNAMAETLAAFADGDPLLLIVDDLQWADELSLSLLASLPAAWLKVKRILLVGTFRVEEETEPLRGLLGVSGVRHLSLGRLDEKTVGTIVGDMLALAAPPATFVSFLSQHSSGNPFFVAEYLRGAVDEGLLYRDHHGRWQIRAESYDHMPLPHTLRDLVGRRIEGLSPRGRALVEVAAVLGRDLDADLFAPLLTTLSTFATADHAATAGEVLEATKELLGRQVLESLPNGRYRFVHDKLREVAYDKIPEPRKKALHGAAGRAIEARFAESPGFALLYPVLARHFTIADDVAQAIDYLEKAGEQALRSSANREAVNFFDSARSLAERATDVPPFRRAGWERRMGSACMALNELSASREHFKRAAALLGWPVPDGKWALARAFAGQVARQALHLALPSRFLHTRADNSDELLEAACAYESLSLLYFFAAELPYVVLTTLQSLNLAERAPPSAELGVAYGNAHFTVGLIPFHPLARRYHRRAFETFEQAKDEASVTRVLSLAESYAIGLGRWDEALEMAQKAAAVAKEIGFRRRWEEIQAVTCHMQLMRGRFRGLLDEYKKLYEPTLQVESQAQSWNTLGQAQMAMLAEGDADKMLQLAIIAEQQLSVEVDRADVVLALAMQALGWARAQNRPRAIAIADRAAALNAMGPPVVFWAIFGYSFLAQVSIELWSTATDPAEKRSLKKKAKKAVAVLFQSARVLPVAAPHAWLRKGNFALGEKDIPGAIRAFERSLKAAVAVNNEYDEAVARLAIAEQLAGTDVARREHLNRAISLFESCGAPGPLRRAKAVASSPT